MSDEGLVRVRGEFNIPTDVWTWIEEQVRARLFTNPADAISFLLTDAKRRHDRARNATQAGPWPTAAERAAGRVERR